MKTLRVPIDGLAPGHRALDAATARYVSRVHRLSAGDRFVAFDPRAAVEADATVVAAGKVVDVDIGALRAARLLPTRRVVLAQGVGKGEKLEGVVRDATELGAAAISPFWSERSIGRRDGDAAHARLTRVAVEAARQSGRGDVPVIDAPRSLESLLEEQLGPFVANGGLGVALSPNASSPIGDALVGVTPDRPIAVVIGPEGGLSDEELERCEHHGLRCSRLGRLTLRTETAAAAALGALLVLDR